MNKTEEIAKRLNYELKAAKRRHEMARKDAQYYLNILQRIVALADNEEAETILDLKNNLDSYAKAWGEKVKAVEAYQELVRCLMWIQTGSEEEEEEEEKDDEDNDNDNNEGGD